MPAANCEVANYLVSKYAEPYLRQVVFQPLCRLCGCSPTREALAPHLDDTYRNLDLLLGHYIFAERGKHRRILNSLGRMAVTTLRQEHPDVLQWNLKKVKKLAWTTFESKCEQFEENAEPKLNKPAIESCVELCYLLTMQHNLALIPFIQNQALVTGELEQSFLTLADFEGIGARTATTIIRDALALMDESPFIKPSHYVYAHPVEQWATLSLPRLDDDATLEDSSWLIAAKTNSYALNCGISGHELLAGINGFGEFEAQDSIRVAGSLSKLKELVDAQTQA